MEQSNIFTDKENTLKIHTKKKAYFKMSWKTWSKQYKTQKNNVNQN